MGARFSGPFFDGRAEIALGQGVDHIRSKVADRGKDLVRAEFAGQIRVDKGVFLASITVVDHSTVEHSAASWTRDSDRPGVPPQVITRDYSLPVEVPDPATEVAVTTEQATYGPWLEGVGSRNDTTRFKGYHGFRRGGDRLDREAGDLANHEIGPYVDRMN